MRRVETKQSIKLRLLALVLALAIIWYSLNPAPGPSYRKKREAEPPDEKKRNLEPHNRSATWLIGFGATGKLAEPVPSSDDNQDDFEWPEFIDG